MRVKYFFKIATAAFLFLIMNIAAAEGCCQPPLNMIILQLQAEQWVTTTTANVMINIDATLDKGNVSGLREEMLSKLAKIAAGEWHITSFNQSQNESGLEQVHAVAELRLAEKNLVNLHAQAKDASRPGLSFKVGGIDFSPSLDELEATRTDLRSKIYHQVNAEIERLHKVNPTQNYVIHTVDFMRMVQPSAPMLAGGNFMARAAEKVDYAPMLAVSNKIQMLATVELVPVAASAAPVAAKQ